MTQTTKSSGLVRTLHAPPPQGVEHWVLGYKDPASDLLWIRLLQDFEVCDNPQSDKPATSPEDKPRCHLSWAYHMVDAITDLAPRFRLAHIVGATMLSIAVDDREGAKRIFDKGMERYPDDYNIHYRGAYHYIYEVGDKAKAANLLLKIRDDPLAPPWFTALAGRLLSEAGQDELAIRILTEYLETNPEGEGAQRAAERLKQLREKAALRP